VAGPDLVTYSDFGLSDATSYRCRIPAFNSNGDAAYSNTADPISSLNIPSSNERGEDGGVAVVVSLAMRGHGVSAP